MYDDTKMDYSNGFLMYTCIPYHILDNQTNLTLSSNTFLKALEKNKSFVKTISTGNEEKNTADDGV